MIKYRSRRIQPIIPTASMSDIAFLLITFFMYTTSFSVDRTEVLLPESVVRQMVEKDAAIIALTETEKVFISDGLRESAPVADFDRLEDTIKEIVAKHPGRQFIIKCDRKTPYRAFNQVYEIMLRNGVTNISLLTEKKTE